MVFASDTTFDASDNPICYEGGTPVFIDTEYDTWNMDPVALERAFEIYPDVQDLFGELKEDEGHNGKENDKFQPA